MTAAGQSTHVDLAVILAEKARTAVADRRYSGNRTLHQPCDSHADGDWFVMYIQVNQSSHARLPLVTKSNLMNRPVMFARLPMNRRTGGGNSMMSVGVATIWCLRANVGC